MAKALNRQVLLESRVSHDLAEIELLTGTLEYADQRNDYADEVELAYRRTIDEFDRVRNRYGSVDPEAGKVIFRIVPALDERADVTVSRFRVSIPSEYPVFLRSRGSSGKYPIGDLDKQSPSSVADISGPQAWQMQLEPGIHDLCFVKGKEDSNVWLEIQLDNLLLHPFRHRRQPGFHLRLLREYRWSQVN